MRPALPRLLFLALTITVATSSAFAQTDNWLGGQGHWENAANWDKGVPVSTSDVVIDQEGYKEDIVFLTSDSIIHSLTMKSFGYSFCDFYVEGGQNFSITEGVHMNAGRLFLRSGGAVSVAKDFTVTALYVESATNLSVAGNLSLTVPGGYIEQTTGGNIAVAGNLLNSGELMNEAGAGKITVSGQFESVGASPKKRAFTQVDSQVNAASLLNSNGEIFGRGTLTVSGTLNNTDDMEFAAPGVVNAMTLENSGMFFIDPGTTVQVGSGMHGSTPGYIQYPDGTLTEHIYQGRTVKGAAGTMTLAQGEGFPRRYAQHPAVEPL